MRDVFNSRKWREQEFDHCRKVRARFEIAGIFAQTRSNRLNTYDANYSGINAVAIYNLIISMLVF